MEKKNCPDIEAVVEEMKKRGHDVGYGQVMETGGSFKKISLTVYRNRLHLGSYIMPDTVFSGKDAAGAADFMEDTIKNDPYMKELREIHQHYEKLYYQHDNEILHHLCLTFTRKPTSELLYRKAPVDGLFEAITVRLEGDMTTYLYKSEAANLKFDSEALFSIANLNTVTDAQIEPTIMGDDIYMLVGMPSALFSADKLGKYFLPKGINRVKVYPFSNGGGFIVACGDRNTFPSEVRVMNIIDTIEYGRVLCRDSFIMELDED